MNDTFENFVSHFFQKQYISLISKNKSDVKFNYFYNYLLSKKDSILITDIYRDHHYSNNKIVLPTIDNSITKILEQIKDKHVFISVPVMEWNIYSSNDDMQRTKLLSQIIRSFHNICIDNNISLNLISRTYSSPGYNQIMGGSSMIHTSSFVVSYENENFKVIKNRWSSDGDILDINTFKPIMSKFYRQKKLERILS